MTWLRALATASAFLLLTACAQGPATSPELPAPTGAAVAGWSGEDLLPAAGGMTRVGAVGVYFAVDVFRYTVVGVDVTTGAELWRQPVDQQGRIHGVVERPTVDPATGLVLASTTQAGEPQLSAFDLQTGEPRWTVPSPWARTTPRLCGGSSVCVLGADGIVSMHRLADGGATATAGALGIVLGGEGDLLVTGDPEQGLVELGRLRDGGYERVWRTRVPELTGSAGAYSQDGGWRIWTDEATGAAVVSLGAAPDPGDRDGRTAAAREPAVGWATAFLDASGTVLDRVTGLLPCFDLPVDASGVPLCRVVASRVGDGAEESLLRTVDRVELRSTTGVLAWGLDLPAPVDLDDVTVSSTVGTVTVPGDGARLVVDRATGRPVGPAPGGPPGNLVLCAPPMPEEEVMVGLTASNGQIIDYLRADPGDLAMPCTPDGELIDLAGVVSAGRLLPDGVGPADIAVGAAPSPADRWVVTMSPAGVLRGVGPGA